MEATIIHVDAGGWGLTWANDDTGRLHQIGAGPDGATAVSGTDAADGARSHPASSRTASSAAAAVRVTA